MLLAVGNDGQFARFCDAAGHPEWSADPRFSMGFDRVKNRDALIPMMQAVTRTRTTAEWIATLEHRAVPCGPINTIGQAFADDQVRARGLKVTQSTSEHARAQTAVQEIATVASPMRLMDTPPVLRNAPPALGEHTLEVLKEMGLDAERIAALQAAKAI
jgi:formyl-CoA transferase